MSQDFAVENKRPSLLPYAGIGAGVGAVGGWALSKVDGLKKPQFSSWEDVINAHNADDKFVNAIKNAGENTEVKEAYQGLASKVQAYKDKIKNISKDFAEHVKTEGEALTNAKTARKEAYTKTLEEVTEKIKNGGITIDGFNPAADGADVTKEAKKWIKNALKNDSEDDILKSLKEAGKAVNEAAKKVTAKADGKATREFTKENAEKIAKAGTDVFGEAKDYLAKLKTPRTGMMLAIGAGVGLLLGCLLRPKAKEQPIEA